MVDRQIIYIGQIPLDTDQLLQNKNAMIGLGYALQALLGTSTVVDGLACAPTSPATLTVNVGPGSICSLQNVDGTAYGSVAADTTHQIVKQGIALDTQNFSCPAPGTAGQSIVYLIQAAYQDVDGGSTVLPYYNASNPSQAWSGPNNSGVSQNTVRKGVCTVQVKAGVAATTGTQTTPTPDVGFTGLWAITVANGQTTVTSGNIAQLTTAPFISPKLPAVIPAVQSGGATYALDTSGAANTITIALSPAVAALTTGMQIRVKVANTNTGAVVINTNGLGNVSATMQDGTAIAPGALQANGIYNFAYDGSHWQFQQQFVNLGVGQGKFQYTSNTVCTLVPLNGNRVTFPNGAIATIPSGGVASTITNAMLNGTAGQTLSASTLYYAYLAIVSGTPTIDWSTTAYATDANTGITIKSGDATRVLVGMAFTGAGPVFNNSATTRGVRSWHNDRGVSLVNSFTTNRTSNSGTMAEINTEIRCNFLLWAGEDVMGSVSGYVSNSSGGDGGRTGIGFDSTSTAENGYTINDPTTANNPNGATAIINKLGLSEGNHFATLIGAAELGGTATWPAITSVSVMTRR
jgi:hypothetical protein